jgi:capsular polysaccharide export protein
VKNTPPLGLHIDTRGPINDAAYPSDLEHILAHAPLDDTHLLMRARYAADWLRTQKLCDDPVSSAQTPSPKTPFVLILDQAQTDPALQHLSYPEGQLREMLVLAHEAHPHANLLVYSPNKNNLGPIEGHFNGADASPNVTIFSQQTNPWDLFDFATAVYTLNASLGFDAILAGHKPHVFGQPWYAGWGLTVDHNPVYRRTRQLTRAQLTLAALIEYPIWYDPDTKSRTTLERTLARASARQRAAIEDARGYVASNILRWKRPHMTRFFGANGITFGEPSALSSTSQAHIAWGADEDADVRVEDGFLRSRGLGAALVRPLSLICDTKGIYFDPTKPSQMEDYIRAQQDISQHAHARISSFTERLIALRLSKYNVGQDASSLPQGYKILVAGQVEDDASIKLGAGEICTNRALLMAAKAAKPDALIIFKPHPDVEAGLRRGKVEDAADIADVVAHNADPIALLEQCDEVWTMTSLIGFEALLRGKPVTCTGVPFYAGWGLTTDLAEIPARRGAHVSLMGLAHAALIDAPRYFDPKTGAAISPEQALDILTHAPSGRSKFGLAVLAKFRQLRARFLGLDG